MGSTAHSQDRPHFAPGEHEAGPLVLGIESSCDETAVALVTGNRTIVAERIASQEAEHAPYGGVVPEIAARAHAERLAPMIEAMFADTQLSLSDVDAVAATAGPGLIGGVMVGLVTGKALAIAGEKPLIAINHLEGHALSPRLSDPALAFPYLLLLVSGGHCQILAVEGVGPIPTAWRRPSTMLWAKRSTRPRRFWGWAIPAVRQVERLAEAGDPSAVAPAPPIERIARTAFLLRRTEERGAAGEGTAVQFRSC